MPARWQDYAMENPKDVLRKKLQSLRPHSSLGLTQQLSQLIEKLQPATIASYQPLPAEPDVTEFNEWIANKCQVVFPKVVADNLQFARGPVQPGQFGIAEPIGQRADSIDLVLVPALAIDGQGNRLGKGKGFYDRFLANYEGTCYAIVFDEEVLPSIPTESHDRRVNGVITPKRTIVFD